MPDNNQIQINNAHPTYNVAGGARYLPLGAMGLLLALERRNMTEGLAFDALDEMEKQNQWLKDATAALNTLRNNRPNDDKSTVEYGTFVDSNGQTQSVHAWMLANGIDIETRGNDTKGMQYEFDAAIGNLKSSIDVHNTTSQADMIKLQAVMDQAGQMTTFASNWESKDAKDKDTVLNNLR
jgi:hypothetical protein